MTIRDSRLAGRGSRPAARPSSSCKAAVVVTAALFLAAGVPVFAHDPGLSSLTVVVDHTQVSATLSMSPADARLLADGRTLDSPALASLDLRAGDTRLAGRVTGTTATDADVRVQLTFERNSASRLSVRSGIPASMPWGHRQLLRINGADGRLLAERMLDRDSGAVDVDVQDAAAGSSAAWSFFTLGVRHIFGGYDHLLFLCALLLGAGRVRQVVQTTTAFTIGHSITLALAVLGIVAAPAAIVEPVIALSIVWAGLENLRRRAGSRWVLAGVFGLVHGFGFAGALRDLGIGASSTAIALPLGAFNAGVEAGQIAVAALVWPAIRQLHSRPALRLRVAPVCAMLIVAAGAYWFAERI